MNSRKENGFTLIEILVTINLSFLAITMAVMFYLFIIKFVTRSLHKIEYQQSDSIALNQIQNLLYKSNSFFINIKQDSIIINADSKKLLFTHNKISLNNLYHIDDMILNSFNIYTEDGRQLNWKKGIRENVFTKDNIAIESNDIKNFLLAYIKDKKTFNINYLPFPISIKKFKNLQLINVE